MPQLIDICNERFEYKDFGDTRSGLYIKSIYCNRNKIGDRAGSVQRGYRQLWINNTCYYEHRIIWLMIYGTLPNVLDHKDRNGHNNSLSNLREATVQENNRNNSLSSNNKSGITGVYAKHTKWVAQITINRKNINLGTFENKQDAIIARHNAEQKYYGEFAPCAN